MDDLTAALWAFVVVVVLVVYYATREPPEEPLLEGDGVRLTPCDPHRWPVDRGGQHFTAIHDDSHYRVTVTESGTLVEARLALRLPIRSQDLSVERHSGFAHAVVLRGSALPAGLSRLVGGVETEPAGALSYGWYRNGQTLTLQWGSRDPIRAVLGFAQLRTTLADAIRQSEREAAEHERARLRARDKGWTKLAEERGLSAPTPDQILGVGIALRAEGEQLRGRLTLPEAGRLRIARKELLPNGRSFENPVLNMFLRWQGPALDPSLFEDEELVGALLSVLHGWPENELRLGELVVRHDGDKPDAKRIEELLDAVDLLRARWKS